MEFDLLNILRPLTLCRLGRLSVCSSAVLSSSVSVAACHDLLSMKQMPSEPSASGRDKCPFPIDRGRCCCQPRHFQPGLRPHNLAALPHDRTESAQAFASAIASLATKSAAVRPEPYALADLHERLEILTRAAEALGHAQEAVAIRDTIQGPPQWSRRIGCVFWRRARLVIGSWIAICENDDGHMGLETIQSSNYNES